MPYDSTHFENEILRYWDDNKTFEKSVKERPENKPYVFYDGPPFATGLPHYGHIVASLIKDVVPRYWTMQGYRVERVWGWDCHGLPIENIVEDQMGLKSKKDIEEMGIVKFNEACRSAVMKYVEDWEHTVKRMGRWVDMESSYKTMDLNFMESVWWVFRELWSKGLIYEGYKAMHVCPRCVTPLSNFEVTQGYKDVKDISVTVKFKLLNAKSMFDLDGEVFVLAWTTTPWTLPGNVALAIGPKIMYVAVESEGQKYILAQERVASVFKDKPYTVLREMKGSDIVGLIYEPLFPYFKETENAFRAVVGDFVSTEDGTGIVHIAPAFGEEDYAVGHHENIGWVQHVTMDGHFIPEVTDFAHQEVKPKEDPTKTDVDVIKWLAANNRLFSKAKFDHSYPHCWRCDTPLLNYATSSWFVKVTEIKNELLENNLAINWVPEHIKVGRFGKWLDGARDWAISRNRFWGAPLPIWKNEDGDVVCIGSVEELEKLTGQKVTDLHKHIVDEISFKKNGKKYTRVPEVLDCWFESGAMPYGQMHYPFENKEKFEAGFPAEFIAEGQDQTRGWFYTLHILATALTRGASPSIFSNGFAPNILDTSTGKRAFKNVIVNGIVLAEDGRKMSKRLKNYPDPLEILEKYGADSMRYYLVSSPVMHAENLNFTEEGVRDVYNRVVNTLWNVFSFYEMFVSESQKSGMELLKGLKPSHVLDRWIMAKLQSLVKEVTENMNAYKLSEASRPIMDFILELSQWYVRRSRDRFKGDDAADKQAALSTLHDVLMTLSKVMAPFTPFISEKIYQELKKNAVNAKDLPESVHLAMWPSFEEKEDAEILGQMEMVRKIVEQSLSMRKDAKIKVRQVLQKLIIDRELSEGLRDIIADEVNVKEVIVGSKIELDTKLTDELKKEGLVREIVRAINQIRKERGLTRDTRINVQYDTANRDLIQVIVVFNEEIKKLVLADVIEPGSGDVEVMIGEDMIKFLIN